MRQDVFISYSRKDSTIVDRIEKELKKYEINCFIDRSNIGLGEDFAEIIAEAICECSVVLFVWSENSNLSENTANEIALAVEFEKTIVSFKIGTFKPSPKLAYRLVRFNRIDAITLNEDRIIELGEKLAQLFDKRKLVSNSGLDLNHSYQYSTDEQQYIGDNSEYEIAYNAGKEYLLRYDLQNAFDYLIKPALNGYRDACFLIAQITQYSTRIFQIADSEFDTIRSVADNGNSFAQYIMARYYGLKNIDITEEAKYAKLSADHNDPYGIFVLAKCYLFGHGVDRSISTYFALLNKAIALDNPFAILELAKQYLYGWDCKKNIPKAMELLKRAMKLNLPESYKTMALVHAGEFGGEIDPNETEKYYLTAISSGFIEGYEGLGNMSIFEPITYKLKSIGIEKGIEYYLKGIEYGEPYCMSALAYCYLNGAVVSKDIRNAMKWFRKAADSGERTACSVLGNMYYSGDGVAVDYVKAWKWFQRGAKMEEGGCHYMLGVMCLEGKAPVHSAEESIRHFCSATINKGYFGGLSALKLYDMYRSENLEHYDLLHSETENYSWMTKDDDKALEYLKLGAEIGDADALFKYGVYMTDLDLHFSDEFQGRKYLEESLSKGNYMAALRLAYIYMSGIGVAKDIDKSKNYGILAIENISDPIADYVYGKILGEYAKDILPMYSDDDEDSEEYDEDDPNVKSVKEIIEEAKRYLKNACEKGYEEAYQEYYSILLTNITMSMYFATSYESLEKEMFHYLQKTLAAKKYVGTQPLLDMGVCCQLGVGRKVDIDEAIEWYKEASELKDKIAPCNIACIYYEKKDEDINNLVMSAYWYEKAIENGNDTNAEDYLLQVKQELIDRGIDVSNGIR